MKSLFLTAVAVLGFASATLAQVPNYVPTNGLVGWWPFNGNANDESGNGNDGTVNGAILTEDRLGNANEAYSFDGVNDFIEVTSNPSLNLNSAFTLQAWINLDSTTSQNPTIICRERYEISTSYILAVNSSLGREGLGINNDPEGMPLCPECNLELYNNTLLTTDEWQQIVATWDGVTISLFRNGVLMNSGNGLLPGDLLLDSEMPLFFGKAFFNNINPSFTNFFFGSLDDMAIWNRALTPEEVQQLYTGDIASVNKASSQPTIAIYPNPTQGQITIDFGSDASLAAHRVFVQTIQGQQAYSANIVEKTTTMNLSEVCGKGLYFVHIIDEQGNTKDIRKIVLQ